MIDVRNNADLTKNQILIQPTFFVLHNWKHVVIEAFWQPTYNFNTSKFSTQTENKTSSSTISADFPTKTLPTNWSHEPPPIVLAAGSLDPWHHLGRNFHGLPRPRRSPVVLSHAGFGGYLYHDHTIYTHIHTYYNMYLYNHVCYTTYYIHIYTYAYINIYIFICIYIYIYIHSYEMTQGPKQ